MLVNIVNGGADRNAFFGFYANAVHNLRYYGIGDFFQIL